MFFQKFSKIVITVFLLLVLGLTTRFYHLAEPKAVVFDEFHFFHFVTEYEKGNYFFDIHPPLGKLILWGNATMYGLESYVFEIKAKEAEKKNLEHALKNAKEVYLESQKDGSDPQISEIAKAQYYKIEAEKKALDDQKIESYDIGKSYNDTLDLWGIRSIPALFGALLVPLLFLFSLQITRNYLVSLLVGIIVLFDTGLVTESQYVLMDSMLLFAMVASAYFAIRYTENLSWKWWIWVSVFSAIAVSIKWTGASIIAFVGIIWLWKMWTQKSWKTSLLQGVLYWITIALLYVGSFYIHFALLPHSGEGDAFHTPEFRKTLENSVDYENSSLIPMNFWGKFYELNVQMGERSAGIRNDHPFASRPEDWIKGEKSIYYWAGPENIPPSGLVDRAWNATLGDFFLFMSDAKDTTPNWRQQIHLFPNPIFWKLFFATTFLALLIVIWEGVKWIYSIKNNQSYSFSDMLMIGGFLGMSLINILPFVYIARPQFLYHAFEWAIFSLLLLGLILSYVFRYLPKWICFLLFGIFGGAAFVFFVIEMPLAYGFSFPDQIGGILFGGF